MYPHGTIYQSGESVIHYREVKLQASRSRRFLYGLIRGVGTGLIGFVVISFLFAFGPIMSNEMSYVFNTYIFDTRPGEVQSIETENTLAAQPSTAEATDKITEIVKVQTEAVGLGVDSHFSLVVPKINAKSKIIANVNAGSEKEYTEALELGVAHAQGTYFPGQGKTIFLFSHSTDAPLNVTRYSAIFYLLRKLEKGDKVVVFFADKKYEYQVTEKKTVGARDIEWLHKDFGEETLILQTCTPPGTNWQRLLVFAKLVK
jgi:LPXTG-site transpeptidase (sortase) family protein